MRRLVWGKVVIDRHMHRRSPHWSQWSASGFSLEQPSAIMIDIEIQDPDEKDVA
jgi:hypothetical protein